MDAILNFFETLFNDHFYVIVIAVILFSVSIVGLIVFFQIRKTQKEDKMYKEHADNVLNSLTPEEIQNISQNVADKETLYEILASTKKSSEEAKRNDSKAKTVKASKQEEADKVSKQEEAVSPERETAVADEAQKKSSRKKATPKPISNSKEVTAKISESNEESKKVSASKEAIAKVGEPSKEAKATRAYTGKWKIKLDGESGKYYAELTASNGGLLLKTELYTALHSLKNGIEIIKKNVESGNIVISLDKYGHYRFKIFNSTNRLICISEDYSSKAKCESGIESVKRFSKSASIIIEETELN